MFYQGIYPRFWKALDEVPCIFYECDRGPALTDKGRDPNLVAAPVGKATPELVDATYKALAQNAFLIAQNGLFMLFAVVGAGNMARQQLPNGSSSLI